MDEARKEGGKIIHEKYKQRMILVQEENKAAFIAEQSEQLEAEAKRSWNYLTRYLG